MNKSILTEELEKIHDEAVAKGNETYVDPTSGYMVLTKLAHERRGTCCGSGCRHCPFGWQNKLGNTFLIVIILFMNFIVGSAQWTERSCDSVRYFTWGTGQTHGQGPVFFPQNVFAGPSRIATETVPDTDPREICSIGLGGTIVMGYRAGLVVDGPGADILVVENAFKYSATRTYAEPARVEVSKDGVEWTTFPFDSITLIGCAGVTPGGNEFDLATIGIDSIRWIRITDVTSIILANTKHPYYDPTLSGFDLDVVMGLHVVAAAFAPALTAIVLSTLVRVDAPRVSTLSVYNVHGSRISQMSNTIGVSYYDLALLPNGVYFVTLDDGQRLQTLKVLR